MKASNETPLATPNLKPREPLLVEKSLLNLFDECLACVAGLGTGLVLPWRTMTQSALGSEWRTTTAFASRVSVLRMQTFSCSATPRCCAVCDSTPVTVQKGPDTPQQALLQRGDPSAAFERAEQCCRSFEQWLSASAVLQALQSSGIQREFCRPRRPGGSAECRSTRAPSLPGASKERGLLFFKKPITSVSRRPSPGNLSCSAWRGHSE